MQNLIVRINFNDLRNETHVELHEIFASVFVKYPPAQLGIALQYDEYRPLLDTEIDTLDIVFAKANA
jgi:hypothetical protein